MGAGIAVPMKKKFHLGGLKNLDEAVRKHPTCIYRNGCFNLITKDKYWKKPTYESLRISLKVMRDQAKASGIEKIAMPKIGCGIDGLSWPRVREMLKEMFEDDPNISIIICYI